MFCIGYNCDLRWQSFDLFSPLYSNGAILVYDITDEDSFFKVTHSAVYLIVTIKVTCTIIFIDVNCVLQGLPTLRRTIIYSCDVTIWQLILLVWRYNDVQ